MDTRKKTATDRKRPRNEIGLRSFSTGVVIRRSGEVDLSVEAEVVEPNSSEGFVLGLSHEMHGRL